MKIQDAWKCFLDKNDPSELLKCVQNYKDQWLKDRQVSQDGKWRQSKLFYTGDHYVRSGNFLESSQYRVRVKENHINNIVQRIQSIFVQNTPIVRVFPNTTSYKDQQDAETCEAYLKMYSRQHKLDIGFGTLVKMGIMFGNGFRYTYYDPEATGVITFDESSGQKVVRYQGEIKTKFESPMRYCFRPGIFSLEDHYDYIRFEPAIKADLESVYGEISSEPFKVFNPISGTTRIDDDLIVKNEYWHKPTSWFPEGLYVCWAGNKILKAMEWPFEDKFGNKKCEWNISHLTFDNVPDQFWALSTIEQVMDLQEQLNKAASMIIEARNLMARPRVVVSHEAQVPAQSITDRPGDILRYKLAGGEPKFITPHFNFSELAAHKQDVRQALGDVAGVSTASRGDIPVHVKTATALQLVLEQDRSQYVPFIKSYHTCVNESYQNILSISGQFITIDDPRVVKLENTYGVARVFHGGVVPSPLDVQLDNTNSLGWTPAMKAERIDTMIDKGLITDPNVAFEMLELNLPNPAFESIRINRQTAQQEIEQMNLGHPQNVGVADNHEVHLAEHDKFIAQYSFKSMPKIIQELHIAHRKEHIDAIAASQGGGGNAGVPQDGGQAVGGSGGEAAISQAGEIAGRLAPPMPESSSTDETNQMTPLV